MNSYRAKLTASAALPSRKILTTQDIFLVFEVKGAAMEASASLRDTPASEFLRAMQSLAPSPHIHTKYLTFFVGFYSIFTNKAFSSGFILAKTSVLFINDLTKRSLNSSSPAA